MARGPTPISAALAVLLAACGSGGYPPVQTVVPAPGNWHRYRVPLYVVIHITECTAAQTVARFQKDGEEATSHYLIPRDEHQKIVRFVDEFDTAYHSGNYQYNVQSVGIEHEGFIRDGGFPESMYRRSAQLTARICRRWNIPIDREHIIGHNEVPDPNHPGELGGRNHHADPGPYWDWDHYMQLVKEAAHS
jgi:N-acetyl-anhydromuramyl-L-alanine amidase AmpD